MRLGTVYIRIGTLEIRAFHLEFEEKKVQTSLEKKFIAKWDLQFVFAGISDETDKAVGRMFWLVITMSEDG